MPSAMEFRKGFGLLTRARIDCFVLKKIQMEHIVVVRNEEYEFPCSLTLQIVGDHGEMLLSDAEILLKLEAFIAPQNGKIVHSDVGSPYECHLDGLKVLRHLEKKQVLVEAKGRSVRRRDIPSMFDRKKDDDNKKRGNEQWLQGYRVGTSFWNSGVCLECGEKLLKYDCISRIESSNDPKDWKHTRCVVKKNRATAEVNDKRKDLEEEGGLDSSSNKRRRSESNNDNDSNNNNEEEIVDDTEELDKLAKEEIMN